MVERDPDDWQDDPPTGDAEDSDDLKAPPEDSGRDYDDTDFDSNGTEGEPPNSEEHGRSEHDKWRRWAWAALVVLVLGVAWALTLSTILLNRSGDNTAELISLFEESQERRDALARQTAQNQAEKQAALKATQAESQAFRSQSQAARASEAESNASARRALAEATLAGARTRQAFRARSQAARASESESNASARRALAQATLAGARTQQAARADRGAPSVPELQRSLDRTIELQRALDRNADLQGTLERNIDLLRTLERSIDLQRTVDTTRDLQARLREAIDALRQAISDLRPRP